MGVLFRLVWSKIHGTGLDGIYSTTSFLFGQKATYGFCTFLASRLRARHLCNVGCLGLGGLAELFSSGLRVMPRVPRAPEKDAKRASFCFVCWGGGSTTIKISLQP